MNKQAEEFRVEFYSDVNNYDASDTDFAESYHQEQLKKIMPSDEEIEKRAEYMQRPRNPNNDIKEEFIYGYMQGADWIINKTTK